MTSLGMANYLESKKTKDPMTKDPNHQQGNAGECSPVWTMLPGDKPDSQGLSYAHIHEQTVYRFTVLNTDKHTADFYALQVVNAFNDLTRLKRENEELKAKASFVVNTWSAQMGRVFESMGSDNPRAIAIDNAINELREHILQSAKENK